MGAKYSHTGCGNDLPIFLRDLYFRICGPISSYSGVGHLRLAAHLVAQLQNLSFTSVRTSTCTILSPWRSPMLKKVSLIHLANTLPSLLETSSASSLLTTKNTTHSIQRNSRNAAAPMAASSCTLQQNQSFQTSQS